jgi:hypothetical protein
MTKVFVLLTWENTIRLWNNKGVALDTLGRKEKKQRNVMGWQENWYLEINRAPTIQ